MKALAKYINSYSYVDVMTAALVSAGLLLFLILLGEPSAPLPRFLAALLLSMVFAPFLLLIAVTKAHSARPVFPLFGAIGAALEAMICAYLQLKILFNRDPVPDSERFEMAVFSLAFSLVFLAIPFVVFLLASFSSVKRFKQLSSSEVTPCPQ